MPPPLAELTARAQTLSSAGDLTGARAVLDRALDPADADPQHASPDLAIAAALHARILIALGDPHAARTWAGFAHAAEERLHGPQDDRTLAAAATHAAVLVRIGNHGRAAQLYHDLVGRLIEREGRDSARVIAAEADLATAEHSAGQCTAARGRLGEAWARHRRVFGDAAPAGIKMLARLGAMERECGRQAESREHLALAQELCARYLPADHPLAVQLGALAGAAPSGRHTCGRVRQSTGPEEAPGVTAIASAAAPGVTAVPRYTPGTRPAATAPQTPPAPPTRPGPQQAPLGPQTPPAPQTLPGPQTPPAPHKSPIPQPEMRDSSEMPVRVMPDLDDGAPSGAVAAPRRPAHDEPVPNGPRRDTPTPGGPGHDGLLPGGPGHDGPLPGGPGHDGPLPEGPGHDGPLPGPPGYDTWPNSPARDEPAADNRPTDPNGAVYQAPLYLSDVHRSPGDLTGRHARADTPLPLPGRRAPEYTPDGRRVPVGSAQVGVDPDDHLLPVPLERPEPAASRRGIVLAAVVVAGIGVAAAVVAVTLPRDSASPAAGPSAPAAPASASAAAPSAAPAVPGAPTGVRLRDNRDSVSLTWTYPKGAEGPILVSGGRTGQDPRAFQQLPAGAADYLVYGLNEQSDYCFTVAVVYSTDRIATSPSVCTRRG